jgi:hypothetical protein
MPAIFIRINEQTGEIERRCPEEMHDAAFGLEEAEEQLEREGFVEEGYYL